MANPKKKKTHSKTHQGRSHLALKKVVLKKCPKCGAARRPHTVCGFCGSYKGQAVLEIKAKNKAKAKTSKNK